MAKKQNQWLLPTIIVIALVIIIGGLVWWQGGKDVITTEQTIKIGVIAPMSGDAASYGEYAINALKLGVEDFNKENKLKFDVVYEDGKCDGKEALTAFNKLINVDKVKYVIGGFCSGETLAIAPVAEQNKIILISAGSGSPDITNAGDYIFRTLASDDYTAKEIAKLAIKNGDNKIVLLTENVDYPQTLKKAFKNYYTSQKGEIVLDETFASNATDFRTTISKLKNQNIGSLYLVANTYKTAALVLKQMKELDYKPKIYTSEGTLSEEALKYYDASYRDLLEGAIFTQPKFDEKNPKTAALLAEYKARYGSTEGPIPSSYLATHYDAVFLLGEAIRKSGDDTTKVKDYLYGIKNWPGTIGNFSFDKNGDAVTDVEAKTVKDGQITSL